MTSKEIKERFINFLYSRGDYFRPVSDVMYNIRCPLCGDTQKNYNEGHLYIKIDTETDFGMPFICFKCNESGVINGHMLDELLCDDPELKLGINQLNKRFKNYDKKGINEDCPISFDYEIPDRERDERKIGYVEGRLGVHFTDEDCKNMKMVTSIYDFLVHNEIKKTAFSKEVMMFLQKDYVGFLSNGNSHILLRDVTDTHKYPWIKYPITKQSQKNKIFYAMSTEIDLFANKDITINLSEGVMDALGIAYHFGYKDQNALNIATTNKYYDAMMFRLIDMGFIGSHITVNIWSDNDDDFNRKKSNNTSTEYYRKILSKYKPVFKEINVYHNIKSKDYGVIKDNIILKKERL